MSHESEFKQGVRSYSKSGTLPNSPYWESMATKQSRNPDVFARNNPSLPGFFVRPTTLGMLPQGRFFDNLRQRYDINGPRFMRYHACWGPLVRRDFLARQRTLTPTVLPTTAPALVPQDLSMPMPQVGSGELTAVPPPGPVPIPGATAVPEPSSFALFGLGVVGVWVVRRARGRRGRA